MASCGRRDPHRPAVDEHLARGSAVQPEQRGEQTGAPGAHEAREPDDLAGVQLEVHAFGRAAGTESPRLEHDIPAWISRLKK